MARTRAGHRGEAVGGQRACPRPPLPPPHVRLYLSRARYLCLLPARTCHGRCTRESPPPCCRESLLLTLKYGTGLRASSTHPAHSLASHGVQGACVATTIPRLCACGRRRGVGPRDGCAQGARSCAVRWERAPALLLTLSMTSSAGAPRRELLRASSAGIIKTDLPSCRQGRRRRRRHDAARKFRLITQSAHKMEILQTVR